VVSLRSLFPEGTQLFPGKNRARFMKTPIDDQFRQEVHKYRLQFACPDCAYFDPEEDRCSEGYPTEEHRSPSLTGSSLLFCKLFEGA
jgi:hypothetical protein